jgi:hypothetical protein
MTEAAESLAEEAFHSPRPVRRRRVYYLSGFDPKGPAYYRSLYHTEAARQSAVTGMRINVGARERVSHQVNRWRIQAEVDGRSVETTYEFLRWDDITRRHWPRSELRILGDVVRTCSLYARSGALWRIFLTSWPPFVTGLYPLVFLLLVFGGATAAALGTAWALSMAGLSGWAALPMGAMAFLGVVGAGRAIERRVHGYWLLRLYAFTARQALGLAPELDARLNDCAKRVVEHAAVGNDDEILIVGHSTGTMMAVSLLARALEMDPALARRGARISLLTLGQCIPILSFLPQAQAFRRELDAVAHASDVDWLDFTAPVDGACFALVDPVAVSGIPRRDTTNSMPKLLSPRFAQLFTRKTYAGIRRNWHRMHFQYLMASELPGEYDYFAITAGPLTLGERFRSLPSIQGFSKFKVFKWPAPFIQSR